MGVTLKDIAATALRLSSGHGARACSLERIVKLAIRLDVQKDGRHTTDVDSDDDVAQTIGKHAHDVVVEEIDEPATAAPATNTPNRDHVVVLFGGDANRLPAKRARLTAVEVADAPDADDDGTADILDAMAVSTPDDVFTKQIMQMSSVERSIHSEPVPTILNISAAAVVNAMHDEPSACLDVIRGLVPTRVDVDWVRRMFYPPSVRRKAPHIEQPACTYKECPIKERFGITLRAAMLPDDERHFEETGKCPTKSNMPCIACWIRVASAYHTHMLHDRQSNANRENICRMTLEMIYTHCLFIVPIGQNGFRHDVCIGVRQADATLTPTLSSCILNERMLVRSVDGAGRTHLSIDKLLWKPQPRPVVLDPDGDVLEADQENEAASDAFMAARVGTVSGQAASVTPIAFRNATADQHF